MNQQVFVTYHPADRKFALQLAETLRSYAIPTMIDEWSFAPGADRDTSFLASLQQCTHLLVILSPEASASPEIDSHIYRALHDNKHIIPVIHRRCEIQLRLRGREHIDFIALGQKDALSKLLRLFGKTFRESGKGRRTMMTSCALVTVGAILMLIALYCLLSFVACPGGSC